MNGEFSRKHPFVCNESPNDLKFKSLSDLKSIYFWTENIIIIF